MPWLTLETVRRLYKILCEKWTTHSASEQENPKMATFATISKHGASQASAMLHLYLKNLKSYSHRRYREGMGGHRWYLWQLYSVPLLCATQINTSCKLQKESSFTVHRPKIHQTRCCMWYVSKTDVLHPTRMPLFYYPTRSRRQPPRTYIQANQEPGDRSCDSPTWSAPSPFMLLHVTCPPAR